MGFTESFSDIKITDEKLKIGHIEYIFEVSINNQVQYFFQLQKFKKVKEKVTNIMKYLIYDKNLYYTCDFNQSEIVYVPVYILLFSNGQLGNRNWFILLYFNFTIWNRVILISEYGIIIKSNNNNN